MAGERMGSCEAEAPTNGATAMECARRCCERSGGDGCSCSSCEGGCSAAAAAAAAAACWRQGKGLCGVVLSSIGSDPAGLPLRLRPLPLPLPVLTERAGGAGGSVPTTLLAPPCCCVEEGEEESAVGVLAGAGAVARSVACRGLPLLSIVGGCVCVRVVNRFDGSVLFQWAGDGG